MTDGFEVFVQLVIAAMTTRPIDHRANLRHGRDGTVGPLRRRGGERVPDLVEWHAVLRPLRAGDARLDAAEVDLDDLVECRRRRSVGAEEPLGPGVALDEVDELLLAAGEGEVAERLRVDREERRGRPVLRAHVRERRAVGDGEARETRAAELDELVHDALVAEDLGDREDEVGGGRADRELAAQADADDDRRGQVHRLVEHRGFGLDAANAPAEDPEPVHHGGVGVGPDERVRDREPAPALPAHLDDAREALEIHLVADPHARGHDAEGLECLLGPAEQGVALGVAFVLPLDIALVAERCAERVDLHRVVDHEVDGDERLDDRGILAGALDRRPHRGEVHGCGDARVVLQQDPRRAERELRALALGGGPAREGRDVLLAHPPELSLAEQALEEDLHRHRQGRGVAETRLAQRVEPYEVDVRAGKPLWLTERHASRSLTMSRSFSSSAIVASTLARAKASSFTPCTIA